MAAGKRVHWHALELRCYSEITEYSRSSTYPSIGHRGQAQTEYTVGDNITENGVRLSVHSTLGGTGGMPTSYEYRLLIGPVDGPFWDRSKSGSEFRQSMETNVVFYGVKLYCEGAVYTLVWDFFEWFVEGVLEYTGGSFEMSSEKFRATDVPIFGIPVTLSSSAFINPTLNFTPRQG